MATLRGSKTEHNLLAAFAGESQARNRYTFAAKIARKEGYEQISSLFLETSEDEKQHAKLFYKLLKGERSPSQQATPQELRGIPWSS